MPWLGTNQAFATYESHVLFVLRFMIDCNVVGGGWVELPAGSYSVTPWAARSSHCQIEAHVHFGRLVTHAPEGGWVGGSWVLCCQHTPQHHRMVDMYTQCMKALSSSLQTRRGAQCNRLPWLWRIRCMHQ